MFLDSVLGRRRDDAPARQQFEPGSRGTLIEAFSGVRTDSGVVVTVTGSLSLPAVYAAIRILSDGIGTLPFPVYKELANDSRDKAKGTWQWTLIHDMPNPEMTASLCWSLHMAHLAGYGEGFLGKGFKPRAGFPRGAVTSLWPVHPEKVDVARINGKKVFFLKDANGIRRPKPLPEGAMLHVIGLTLDGMRGISPIELGRKSIAAGLAMTSYTDSFFGNAALPSGILTTEHELSDPAFDRLTRRWRSTYGGKRNAGKVAILEQGMTFEPISVSQRDAQFVEQAQLNIADVARLFRIPMSRLEANPQGGSLTYRTTEGDDLHLAKHSFRPWMVKIEQALNTDPDLFPGDGGMYAEMLIDALLRGSTKERYDAFSIATGGKAWMRPSEARALENLPFDEEIDEEPTQVPVPAPEAAD